MCTVAKKTSATFSLRVGVSISTSRKKIVSVSALKQNLLLLAYRTLIAPTGLSMARTYVTQRPSSTSALARSAKIFLAVVFFSSNLCTFESICDI